uniref:ABC transporter permease n=1 Tax=Strongyloides venezuelensis TaxID=75913 RepID=A0A0K0ETW4_STRVS
LVFCIYFIIAFYNYSVDKRVNKQQIVLSFFLSIYKKILIIIDIVKTLLS